MSFHGSGSAFVHFPPQMPGRGRPPRRSSMELTRHWPVTLTSHSCNSQLGTPLDHKEPCSSSARHPLIASTIATRTSSFSLAGSYLRSLANTCNNSPPCADAVATFRLVYPSHLTFHKDKFQLSTLSMQTSHLEPIISILASHDKGTSKTS